MRWGWLWIFTLSQGPLVSYFPPHHHPHIYLSTCCARYHKSALHGFLHKFMHHSKMYYFTHLIKFSLDIRWKGIYALPLPRRLADRTQMALDLFCATRYHFKMERLAQSVLHLSKQVKPLLLLLAWLSEVSSLTQGRDVPLSWGGRTSSCHPTPVFFNTISWP